MELVSPDPRQRLASDLISYDSRSLRGSLIALKLTVMPIIRPFLIAVLVLAVAAGSSYAADASNAASYKTTITRIAIDGDVVGTPFIGEDGTIFACDKDAAVYRIQPDLKTIKKWKMDWGSISRPTPIDKSRILLIGKMGSLGILENKTSKLEIKQTLPMTSVPGAAPTCAKDASGRQIFLLPASNNKLYVVSNQLGIVNEFDLPYDAVDSAVPLSTTQFVVNTIRGHVVFVDIATGKTKVVDLHDEVRAAPAILEGNIYVFTKSGMAYVFDKTGRQVKKLTHDAPLLYDAIALESPPRLRLYDQSGGVIDLTADGALHRVGKATAPEGKSAGSAALPPVKVGHFSAPGAKVHGVAYGDHELRVFDAQSGKQLGSWTWPTQIRSFVYTRGNEIVFAAPNPNDREKYELVVVRLQPAK